MKFTFAAALALATAAQAATVYVTLVEYVYKNGNEQKTQDAAVTVYVNPNGDRVDKNGIPLAIATIAADNNKVAAPIQTDLAQPEQPESQPASQPPASQAPEPSTAPAPSSAPSTDDGNLSSWEKQILDTQNSYRARHGAAPFTWDAAAAKYIADYGNRVCSPNLVHSGGKYGENLAWGYGGPKEVVDAWCSESLDGSFNHHSQVIWKGSTGVGCASACNGQWVGCSYLPAGNVQGSYGANVSP